jgi:hypothetical protein
MRKRRKQQATHHKPQPTPAGKKFSKWLVAGIVSALSALALAVVNQATDVFKIHITPLIVHASCVAAEALRTNTAKDRFTVVVLPFANDLNNTAQTSIRAALADEYGLNVISSCATIQVAAVGNRDRNIADARQVAASIIKKYDADMLIFGNIDRDTSGDATDMSKIIITAQPYLEYLYDNNIAYYDRFDGSRPDSYLRRLEFRHNLIEHARLIGESSGCFNAFIRVCKEITPPLSQAELVNKLQRLRQIQTLYVNKRFYRYANDVALNNFLAMGLVASGIAIELYANRGVRELATKDNTEDMSDVADKALRLSDIFSTKHPNMLAESPRTASAAVARASVMLLRGEACGESFWISKAQEWFEQAQPDAEPLDTVNGARSVGLLHRLALALTKLALYATAAERDANQLREAFEAEAQRARSDVMQYRGLLFSGEFVGDEFKQVREKITKRIDDELTVIETALKQKDQVRARQLLSIGSCR